MNLSHVIFLLYRTMTDGGKGIWEHSWRACVERIHNKKSQGNISETHVQSRSGTSYSSLDYYQV